MQYVNDDMDELFRRAAENYPLDTSSADWNKVLTALQGEALEQTIAEKKKNKNGRLLWLLLLLPLGLVCNQLYSPGIFSGKQVSNAGDENENITVDRGTSQKSTNSSSFSDDNNTVTIDRAKVDKGSTAENRNKNSVEPGMPTLKTTYSSYPGYSKTERKNYSSDNNITHTKNQITNDKAEANLLIIGLDKRKRLPEVLFSHPLQNDFTTAVTKKMNPLFSSSEENSKQSIRVARRKRFYAGVVGGIDGTTIKFQKIENAGAIYGLLFGYQLNKKWSVETGAFVEKKYYYTKGEYFNTAKAGIPSSWQIDDVSGNCKMIEIPVSLKYNFSQHKNSNWFATVGASSYFMKKQNYSYDYYWGGWQYTRKRSYDTSSTYLISNVGLSVGYSHRLGNFADLRVEPYLKLPVSGIGIGSLPMFSTGLQIGITRKF
jgi:hypothetical protein